MKQTTIIVLIVITLSLTMTGWVAPTASGFTQYSESDEPSIIMGDLRIDVISFDVSTSIWHHSIGLKTAYTVTNAGADHIEIIWSDGTDHERILIQGHSSCVINLDMSVDILTREITTTWKEISTTREEIVHATPTPTLTPPPEQTVPGANFGAIIITTVCPGTEAVLWKDCNGCSHTVYDSMIAGENGDVKLIAPVPGIYTLTTNMGDYLVSVEELDVMTLGIIDVC